MTPSSTCQRAIGLDEVTPWSHMDYGITHEYLVREYNKGPRGSDHSALQPCLPRLRRKPSVRRTVL